MSPDPIGLGTHERLSVALDNIQRSAMRSAERLEKRGRSLTFWRVYGILLTAYVLVRWILGR